MPEPWSDWIPGVLNRDQVRALREADKVRGHGVAKKAPGLSSFDLHLTERAWELTDGSFKPDEHYSNTFLKAPFATPLALDAEGGWTLRPARTYVFELDEKLVFGGNKVPIWGQATAKSSVGRVDVLARLIVDGMRAYECFSPDRVATGEMFLEVTSITFPVRVAPGASLSQLRLFYGPPDRAEIRGRELLNTILPGRPDQDMDPNECLLRVDLSEADVGGAAFRARGETAHLSPIDLTGNSDKIDPTAYWELVKSQFSEDRAFLKLEQNAFYILRSLDRLALTRSVAAYCRAIDETIGEMRIHYAGFVHPYFGRNRADGKIGTPLIFEVRGHDLPVNLVQQEVMAKMTLYRMSEDAALDDMLEKPDESPYGNQTLNLSKYFADWE